MARIRLGMLLLLALLAFSGCATITNIVVDKSGKGTHTSLRQAVSDWREGMEFQIRNGVYDEQLILKSKMDIRGESRDGVVIHFTGEGPAVVGRDVSDIRISNLRLEKNKQGEHPVVMLTSTDVQMENCTVSGAKMAGIRAANFGNLALRDCLIEDNEWAGIFFDERAQGSVKKTLITKNGTGIVVERFSSAIPQEQTAYREEAGNILSVSESTIQGNMRVGFSLRKGARIEILHNTIVDNGEIGIEVDSRSDVVIRENLIANQKRGLVFQLAGFGVVGGNQIKNHSIAGVVVYGPSKPEIVLNDIFENTRGLVLTDGTEALIKDNRIRSNQKNGVEINEASRPTLEGNWILKNSEVGVVILKASKPTIRKNLLVENGWYGLLAGKQAKPLVLNNTFYRNVARGAWFTESSEGTFANNAVVGSQIGLSFFKNQDIEPKHQANLVWGNENRDYEDVLDVPKSNISKNPLFTDPTKFDFSPQSGSPLIGEGDSYIGAIPYHPASGS